MEQNNCKVFVKLESLKPNTIYTIQNFFLSKTPFGNKLNAIIDDDDVVVTIPSYLISFEWSWGKMKAWQDKRNFMVFVGMKTTKDGKRTYPNIKFVKQSDSITSCFCSNSCKDCLCSGYFLSQLDYMGYSCACTGQLAYKFQNVALKMLMVRESLRVLLKWSHQLKSRILTPMLLDRLHLPRLMLGLSGLPNQC